MHAAFHIAKLKAGETTKFRAHGNSMTGKIEDGQHVTVEPVPDLSTLDVGDIVFCKVCGHIYDAHLVTGKRADGKFMISNNKGHANGWTKTIYGKIVKIED